jgi:hypothetical protein
MKLDERLLKWWAVRCLSLAGVGKPPVDLRRVAATRLSPGRVEKIEVQPATLDHGHTGRMTVLRGKRGLRAVIAFDESLEAPSARSVIAHELWHLVRTFCPLKPASWKREEAEAELFARRLLMPERFLKPLVSRYRRLAEPSHFDRLALVHDAAELFVVPLQLADAGTRDFRDRRWKSPLRTPPFAERRHGRGQKGRAARYRVTIRDHAGKVTVLQGLGREELESKIEMTVTWSGRGPLRGKPGRNAYPAVVVIENERKKRDCWYYEGVGVAGVLDLLGLWGKRFTS